MRVRITPERSLTIQRIAASFKSGTMHPLKVFKRLLILTAAASTVIPLSLLHTRLIQFWLKARIPPLAWRLGQLLVRVDHQCIKAVVPWMSSRLIQIIGRKEESSHKWCFQLRLGRPVGGQSGVRLLVSPRATPAYQLPRDAGGFLDPENLPTSLKGAPRFWSGRTAWWLWPTSITKAVWGHALFTGWLVASSFGHRRNSSC